MTLYDLLDTINDNTVIEVFQSSTAERIGTYDGKENIPEWWNDDEITDIFTGMVDGKPTLCIEINIKGDSDYDDESNYLTPCDVPDSNGEYHCPYDAQGSDACRCYCGLGVDE